MSGTLTEPERAVVERRLPATPDASLLQDRVPDALKLPRIAAGMTALVGVVFWFYALQPLHHTDVWGHLAYGRVIWTTGRLPATEPLMPLAAGMRWINTSWLSQLVGYGAVRALGITAMQGIHAASIAGCVALLLWGCYRKTRSAGWAVIGVLAFLLADWQQLMVIRPQLAGLLAFVVLLVLPATMRPRRSHWIAVPVLFALWANLHGSFPVGLVLLACFAAGRGIDLLRRTGSISALWRDRLVRHDLLLTQLAAAAVLVNPYGLGLYAEVLTFSRNPNLADLTEWQPLALHGLQGEMFVLSVLLLPIVYRLSPRRVAAWEALALMFFGVATLSTARMVVWWAPLVGYVLALHGHAVWRRFRGLGFEPADSPRSGKWTVVALGVAWIAFAYTPFGLNVLHPGRPVEMRKIVSAYTPLAAVEYLKRQPQPGQLFNIYEWGDFLLWDAPRVPVFVASHAHLVPRQVWRDYMHVIEVRSGWEDILARYGVNTVLLDQAYRQPLIQRLRQDEQWTVGYEDAASVVFVRKKPI